MYDLYTPLPQKFLPPPAFAHGADYEASTLHCRSRSNREARLTAKN